MVQLHRTSSKVTSKPGAHCNYISIGSSIERQQNIPVLLIRVLLPLPDRLPTAIVAAFVMDRAALDKTEREFLCVLRFFGGEVCSDWRGHVEHHWYPPLCDCTVKSVAPYCTKRKYARKSALRRLSMAKRYTPTSAAAEVEAALRLLEGRWKLVILFHLFGGKVMRFSDLERAIPNITQKMLGQQLRQLEADSIVARKVYPQVPPKVEYRLTDWGQSLCPALDAILKWADRRRVPGRRRKLRP